MIRPAQPQGGGSAAVSVAPLKQESTRASQSAGETANVVPHYKRFVMDLQSALARDTTRARAMLQELFGKIRLVDPRRP